MNGNGIFLAPINRFEYNDGHTRTFKGHPPMNKEVRDMLYGYIRNHEPHKAMLFFVDIMNYDNDYAEFLLRELYREMI